MEFLETNLDWLINKIKASQIANTNVFDLPGQVETVRDVSIAAVVMGLNF
jgi:Conserved hypothetical ATP binding protein